MNREGDRKPSQIASQKWWNFRRLPYASAATEAKSEGVQDWPSEQGSLLISVSIEVQHWKKKSVLRLLQIYKMMASGDVWEGGVKKDASWFGAREGGDGSGWVSEGKRWKGFSKGQNYEKEEKRKFWAIGFTLKKFNDVK